ncbi:TIR domain-containing protein [Psychrilyobacter atlanticus]|uniref:SLOG domain-containing protein n=1 Tax=Psychrilyobacter atlanticus TaxID=271091 RepID=UPI0004066E52|nr:TIR domain-containing protein [Psychrilyobacter atlanticus]
MIYFLRPEISGLDDQIWNDFYDGAHELLRKFRPQKVIEISNLEHFSLTEDRSSSLLIFFVPHRDIYRLKKVLQEAVEIGMKIFPISTSEENRFPIEILKEKQSFDIVTEKELRGLNDNFIKLIGECFAREVITLNYPAFFGKKMNIFLSHRRNDGERKARYFKKSLHPEKEHVFIDLHEIRTAEDAQKKIEANLTEDADILIFVQTETTFESHYQLVELKKAFELDIPVLWVTLGLEKNEYRNLPLHPVGAPHFEIKKFTADNVNQITNYAFDMIRLRKQRLLDNVIYKFKSLKEKGITYRALCDKHNLYLINRTSESAFGIETSKMIFKCLCREYEKEDFESLKSRSEELDTNSNTIYINKGEEKELGCRTNLKKYSSLLKSRDSQKINGGIIISGSFPENLSLKYQQNIIDSVSIIVEDILNSGGKIIFGSHPTFQGLILEKSKKYNTSTEKKVKLYASKKFKKFYEVNMEYFHENAEVYEIEEIKGETEGESFSLSLTKMREEMINDSEAIALITFGGKDAKDSFTKIPGIDEEISLAEKKGIPVYVIGSTGGRSATIVKEGFENPIRDENKYEEVAQGDNFRYISEIILDELSRK